MQRAVDRPAHALGRGQEIARVEPDDSHPLPAGRHGEGVEQTGLPDTPRAVHEEHRKRG